MLFPTRSRRLSPPKAAPATPRRVTIKKEIDQRVVPAPTQQRRFHSLLRGGDSFDVPRGFCGDSRVPSGVTAYDASAPLVPHLPGWPRTRVGARRLPRLPPWPAPAAQLAVGVQTGTSARGHRLPHRVHALDHAGGERDGDAYSPDMRLPSGAGRDPRVVGEACSPNPPAQSPTVLFAGGRSVRRVSALDSVVDQCGASAAALLRGLQPSAPGTAAHERASRTPPVPHGAIDARYRDPAIAGPDLQLGRALLRARDIGCRNG